MLSRKGARNFFLLGTGLCFGAFTLLTLDTLAQVPKQTGEEHMTPAVVRGKHLWDRSNCMGCHTILGEGAYYAPELTKVYERRGESFIRAMLEDPEAMYPGERRMYDYDFSQDEISDLVAFLKWVGQMDLNGFPPKPDLGGIATPEVSGESEPVARTSDRPMVFNQMCVACHSLGGQGGQVGPALDGVGDRLTRDFIGKWLADPQKVKPGTAMPKLPLTPEQIKELEAFLSEQKSR